MRFGERGILGLSPGPVSPTAQSRAAEAHCNIGLASGIVEPPSATGATAAVRQVLIS